GPRRGGDPDAGPGAPHPRCDLRERLLAAAPLSQRVQADDAPRPAELDERDALLVAVLEAHGRARRHVEPHPERSSPLEAERAVDLEEVEVRADLDRAIACVGHGQLDRSAALIRDDVALTEQILAGNHGWSPSVNNR